MTSVLTLWCRIAHRICRRPQTEVDEKEYRSPLFWSKRRNEEQEKLRRLQQEVAKAKPLKVLIPDEIAVGELASRLKKTASEVIKQLMKLGVMASVSQFIDF